MIGHFDRSSLPPRATGGFGRERRSTEPWPSPCRCSSHYARQRTSLATPQAQRAGALPEDCPRRATRGRELERPRSKGIPAPTLPWFSTTHFVAHPRHSTDGRSASYVCAVSEGRANLVGVAAIDPANAGEILVAQFPDNHRFRRAISLLHSLRVQELLVPMSHSDRYFAQLLRATFGARLRAAHLGAAGVRHAPADSIPLGLWWCAPQLPTEPPRASARA